MQQNVFFLGCASGGLEQYRIFERFRDTRGGRRDRCPMTPAEEYHQRAKQFFELAAKSSDPGEREALPTFAYGCLQLGRTEEYRLQKQRSMCEKKGQSRA
jgi:hypothetical protein